MYCATSCCNFSIALQINSAKYQQFYDIKISPKQHNIIQQMYNNNIIFFATASTPVTAFTYAAALTRVTAAISCPLPTACTSTAAFTNTTSYTPESMNMN